ncbi:MAG: helix-turn-helix domain-containing protein [Nitrospirota bacterium]|nr:helix-turn-helix domain-containing protein [Nitrospirota bacterium]
MRVRALRVSKGFGLREFARQVDISPTYLSQVERGEVPPPAEPRVVTIAQALDQDPAELLALAGRIPQDIRAALMRHPAEMTALIAAGARLTREQLLELVLLAQKFPGGKKSPLK